MGNIANVRRTSRKAYEYIRDSKFLGRMQWRVYDHLFDFGPATGNEIDFRLAKGPDPSGLEINPSFHKRLSELEEFGLVERVGTKPCAVSGMEATAWDVTDTIPEGKPDTPKRPTPAEISLAVEEIRKLLMAVRKADPVYAPSKQLIKLGRWLAHVSKSRDST